MRLFQHIILDFENSKNIKTDSYWASNFLLNKDNHLLSNLNFYQKYSNKDTVSHNNTFIDLKYTTSIVKPTHSLKTLLLVKDRLTSSTLPTWYNLININFLRKERLYTKLKYSRSPAYDTVSGGAAAIFAGFLGFLVSEKFGMELVDSGDFYFLTMYIVFLSFSVRPLLTVLNPSTPLSEIFSLKPIFEFYTKLFTLFIKFFS